MTTTQVIWLIVAVVVLAAIIAIAMQVSAKRKAGERRAHAAELRDEAVTTTSGLDESQRRADEAAAEAEIARAEAARAQERAAEASQGVQVEEARVEDRVREADRIDPDVDTRSDDYAPQTPSASGTTADETDSTTHSQYADGEDATRRDDRV